MKSIYILIAVALFISGCGSKKYYTPEDTHGSFKGKRTDINYNIIDYNANGATIKDYKLISKDGVTQNRLKKGFKFINNCEGTLLTTNNSGVLLMNYTDKVEELKFDKNIISATIKDNLLAIGFTDNSIILYDTNTNTKQFQDYFDISTKNDAKTANPVFLNSVILYPTLDGKIIIVDIAKKSVIKTINVDPSGTINNITFLSSIGDALIAATPSKVFSFINGSVSVKDFEVTNIVLHNKDIIITTLDGQIIRLNKSLNILNSKKFKFAKFHALGSNKYIYALELNDYLIRLDSDLENIKVFGLSFDENLKSIMIGDKLYFDDDAVILE